MAEEPDIKSQYGCVENDLNAENNPTRFLMLQLH